MSIFVITDAFLQYLPEKETGNYIAPFLQTTGPQISVDENGIIKNKYIEVIQANNLTIAASLFDALVKINSQCDSSQKRIIKITVDTVEDTNDIFLEVAYHTNNLLGLIIDNYNNTQMKIDANQTTYKDSTIHVYDMSNAMQQIVPNAYTMNTFVNIGDSSKNNYVHIK